MKVLFTRKLSQGQVAMVNAWNWEFDIVSALEIIHIEVPFIPEESDAWIVTSHNSWPAIKNFIALGPRQIYCVGNRIENELNAVVASQVIRFDSMSALAAAVKTSHFRRLVYFCGDHHRQELDKTLAGASTLLTKVVTHTSRLTCPVINETYDAIFVFSPRSAESILKQNSFPAATIFACIGITTEKYLHSVGILNTFSASHPDSETLLKEFRNTLSQR